jgi:hypothetical protein
VNNAKVLAQKQPLTNAQAIFWGGLVAGILDAVDGVIAFGTQGLNPIQVLQYIASGALGKSAFQGGLATAALGAVFSFRHCVGGCSGVHIGNPALGDFENACCARRTALRCRSVFLHELSCASAIGCGGQHIPPRPLS